MLPGQTHQENILSVLSTPNTPFHKAQQARQIFEARQARQFFETRQAQIS